MPNCFRPTQLSPTEMPSKGTIVYGPYANVNINAQHELLIHFENNSPFLTTTKLQREIKVSHWGNAAFANTLDLLHSGATLKVCAYGEVLHDSCLSIS